jgi:[ribosomal protein S5]-alanine N-acetyltransferase
MNVAEERKVFWPLSLAAALERARRQRIMTVELKLAHCTVRTLEVGDAASLAQHANDRRVSSQLRDRFPYPYTTADATAFIDIILRNDPLVCFAIVVDGHCAGGIGLERLADVHRLTGELGYWLGVEHWGRGIATEAVNAVTQWGFGAPGLKRIFAQPLADNLASCRVLEKAGFVLEGTLKHSAIKDGVLRDQRMYARFP